MKTYTREEAFQMMLNGKHMTSDEFHCPDEQFCLYNEAKFKPFRFIDGNVDTPLDGYFKVKTWRVRRLGTGTD